MVYVVTAKRLIFSSACRFVTDQVGIGAADTGGAYSFVSVYHDFVVRCFLHRIQIVVVHPLSIVVLATWNDIAYIAAFYRIISVVCHELVCLVHVAFIVTYRSRSFMVHHQFYAFACSVTLKLFYIEVRIGGYKIEDIIFAFPKPVFPTFVPAFYQYLVESMLCCKINVTFYVGSVGRVFAVRFCFIVIGFAQFYTG